MLPGTQHALQSRRKSDRDQGLEIREGRPLGNRRFQVGRCSRWLQQFPNASKPQPLNFTIRNDFSLHNSEDYWTDPQRFYPERFLEKEFKIENDDSMTFLPFGAGEGALYFHLLEK